MKKLSDEYLPVRKAQTVYGSISGNYAFRGEKTIWFESTLERDFILKQEFNNNVI
ncbi:transposase protein A, partial [Acinetobacter baumannii ABNIH20]